MANGNALLAQNNYAQAIIEFQRASTVAGNLNDSGKKKAADQSQLDANKLAQAGEEVARTIGEKRIALDKAMAAGNAWLTQSNYAEATFEFQKAIKLAVDLKEDEKKKTADESQRFSSALAQAKAARNEGRVV